MSIDNSEIKQRRKNTSSESVKERRECIYVLPSGIKYQEGDTFICCNGTMTDFYNNKIVCTENHTTERALETWEKVLEHRGYRNEDNSITSLRSEKCPLCPAILAGQLGIKKKHLKFKHLEESRILCNLPEGTCDSMIEEAIYKLSKIFITQTGYNIQTTRPLRVCKYYNCREINNSEHLKLFTHNNTSSNSKQSTFKKQ